jgi:hypothetical protein
LSHYKCFEYKPLKEKWEKVIEEGSKRCCPCCGVGGVKNDACTHMTWGNCKAVWCYFWGISDKEVDKADPKKNIYSHNDAWQTNPKRCPMYLYQIYEVDNRYVKTSDQPNKEFFHKLLMYTKIRAFLNEHGMDKFEKMAEIYPSVREHGYDLKEAMTIDLTLLKRK